MRQFLSLGCDLIAKWFSLRIGDRKHIYIYIFFFVGAAKTVQTFQCISQKIGLIVSESSFSCDGSPTLWQKHFVRRQLTRNQGGLRFVENPPKSSKRRPLLKRFVRPLGRKNLLYIADFNRARQKSFCKPREEKDKGSEINIWTNVMVDNLCRSVA